MVPGHYSITDNRKKTEFFFINHDTAQLNYIAYSNCPVYVPFITIIRNRIKVLIIKSVFYCHCAFG